MPSLTLSVVPPEDPAVYRMLSRADSLGVFQVESRAQMSMLPRLRPKEFYDLVIEVAIVRPGPIQGDMVHPYLQRRAKSERIEYPSKELEAILSKTLGVPLFQEQAMRIAIVAGGFTPGEADKLRRAMATFKRTGTIGAFRDKMIAGMLAKNYPRDFAERCFRQIEGFGEYGFPESHAASFALLVYASAWLKCRYPDVFAAALLNAQPMGFYAPAQIVRDAREHGVEVRPPDVNFSDWDATLEPGPRAGERLHELHCDMRDDIRSTHAIRLGLREIKGLKEENAKLIVACKSMFRSHRITRSSPRRRGPSADLPIGKVQLDSRLRGNERSMSLREWNPLKSAKEGKTVPYDSVRDLWLRTGLPPHVLERLADADAFSSLGLSRRDALWAVKALGRVGDRDDDLPLFAASRVPGAAQHEVVRCRPGTPLDEETAAPDQRCTAARCTAPGAREAEIRLPPMPIGEEVVNDYRFLRLSLRAHPAQFLRADLFARDILRNEALRSIAKNAYVKVSGLVTCRQRPGSANGVIFMTIEDESAIANVIVWPKVFERLRPVVLGARYVCVLGKVQKESGVIHVVAEEIDDLTHLLGSLSEYGADIESLARCDEVRRPINERREVRKGGRESQSKLATSELAADLDVPARGSAHVPAKRAGLASGSHRRVGS